MTFDYLASLKKYGFKTLKSLPFSLGCLFLYPIPDNKNTWQDLVFRAQATVMDTWLLAWGWRTASLCHQYVGIPQQYPHTFSKTIWDKASQISLFVLSLKTLHIFSKILRTSLKRWNFSVFPLYYSLSLQTNSQQTIHSTHEDADWLRFQDGLSYKCVNRE